MTGMLCPHCRTALQPARAALGGLITCPGCQRTVRIAAKGVAATPAVSGGSPSRRALPTASAPLSRWYLRGEDGPTVGPMSKEQLDELARACELNSTTEVWQEGWQQAIWAAQLYPWVADVVPVLPDAGDSSATGHGMPGNTWVKGPSSELTKSPPAWALAAFVVVTALGAFVMLLFVLALQCPGKPALIAIGGFVGGMIAIGGAIFEWKWFWSHRKSTRVRSLFGPVAARFFYAGAGAFLILCAVVIALENGQAGAGAPAQRKAMRRPAWRQRIPIEIGRH
jgi:hypothetical protein